MRLGWHLPLERLSASSIGMMIACPEQFRQKYLLKTEEQNFDARFMGTVDHDMSRQMATAKLTGVSDWNIEEMYRGSWNKALDQDGEPTWIKHTPDKAFETGVKMSQLYWDEVINQPDYNPTAVEERVEFTIPGLPVRVIGYVDTIVSGIIRERKTVGQKTTKPKPKWRLQGLIYQYAVGLPTQWDIVTRQVTPQLYLAKDWPDLFLPVQKPDFIRTMIRDAAKRMNDLYQQHGANEPWPTTGYVVSDWLCDYCAIGPKYNGTCVAWDTGGVT